MEIPVIIDIIAAVIVLGFVISGARRGLFRALAGLVILVLALVGARITAQALAPPVMELVRPVMEQHIESKVDGALNIPEDSAPAEGQMPEDGLDARDLLALLGVDEGRLDELTEQVQESVRDTGVSLLTAVAENLAEPVIYSVIFLLAFVLLVVGLNLLAKLMDLAMKLPVLHGANALGGAAVGLLEGLVAVALLAMLLQRLGVPLEGSRILHIFATWLA